MSERYSIRAHCGNCGEDSRMELERGTALEAAECPVCGCRDLTRALLGGTYRIPATSTDEAA